MEQRSMRVEAEPADRWTFGHFELDERSFELRCEGRRLTVQPKVIDLLVFLVKNRDRVVSKDELLDKVWPDVSVCEASLSQAVSLARKQLGDGPRTQRYLRTVRGRGFQFVAPVAAPEAHAAPRWSQQLDLADGEPRCLLVQLVGGELRVAVLRPRQEAGTGGSSGAAGSSETFTMPSKSRGSSGI